MNKKGLSNIIATVLVILLVFLLIIFLWQYLVPLVTDNFREEKLCMDAVATIGIKDVCIHDYSGDKNFTFVVTHNSNEINLVDIQIIITKKDGNSISRNLVEMGYWSRRDLPGINEESKFSRKVTELVGSTTGSDLLNEFEIAPVIEIGNQKVTCSSTIKKKVENCAG